MFAPRSEGPDRGPTTGERMSLYERLAPPLAAQAATDALRRAGTAADEITHLITVSCTGFAAPGPDLALVELLGLSSQIQRSHVGFMGCHGVINGLRLAMALAATGAIVLVVCVELCTIHLHITDRPDRLVANALFADGAAACVVGMNGPASRGAATLHGTASTIFPDSRSAMGWQIGDHGFEMTLAESVPGLIREHLKQWLSPALRHLTPSGVSPSQLQWCIHPGGPRVLDAVRDAMALPEESLAHSRSVLRTHGNMSSATVLFILRSLLDSGARGPAALLAFGPGLCAELCLVEL